MNIKALFKQKPTTLYKVEMDKVIALVSKDWKLGELHGMQHWQRVERNGQILAHSGVNPFVVKLFAYFHDACRENNDSDIEHGSRAAKLVESLRGSLLKELTQQEIEQLKTACELHTTTLRTGDPTIDVCFDADKLDLIHTGRILIPSRMATEYGKYLATNIDEYNKIF